MRFLLAFLFLFGMNLPIAVAQDDDLWGDYEVPEASSFWTRFETDISGQAGLATHVGETGGLVFDGGLTLSTSKTLASGKEIGGKFGGRVQFDRIVCPQLSPGAAPIVRPAGAFSSASVFPCDEGDSLGRVADTASVFVQARWGRVTLGRESGVAAKYFRGPDAGFTHSGVGQAILNPTGVDTIRARDDMSGRGAKLSVESPRILGTKVGISHTFEGNFEGLDRDGKAIQGVEIDKVTEISGNFSHLFRQRGVRLRVGASASRAEIKTTPVFVGSYEDVTTISVSGRIEKDDWDLGISWLHSDNGLRGNGEYESWTIGAGIDKFDWQWRAIYGESNDEANQTQGSLASINASRALSENATVTLGMIGGEISAPSGLVFDTPNGAVVEISLNF